MAAPLAAALALLALPLLSRPAPAVQVRVASWNILNGLDTSSNATTNETSRNDDWWQVVDSIRRVDPDIVGFAELNENDFEKLPALAAALGYPHYALSSEKMNSGSYRQGVMSKFEITASSLVKENGTDPDAAEIKRWPLHAVVAVPGALNPLHVFVVHTHPGTTGKANRLWRAMNAWRMRQYLDRMAADLPEDVEYVAMGDFNEDATGSVGAAQHESFTYDYYLERLDAGTLFGSWFHLGSDFPWSSDTNFTLPYKLYPDERFNGLRPVAGVCRTGFSASDSGALATYPSTGNTLDYILFSPEIMQSAYGAPECEVYWGANDTETDTPGLSKPGPWLPTLATNSVLTESKKGLDHLMVFGDFHMIDAVAGLSPVAIISEVVHHPDYKTASYVEISNTGAAPLKVDGYKLEVYFNGASTNGLSVTLSGSIGAGESIWITASSNTASNHWGDVWDHAPDRIASGLKTIDGDDAIVLKNASGNIIDVYGAIGIDGTGKPWEYTAQTATRVPGVTEPIPVWSADEWTFAAHTNATPGHHDSISEADASVSGLAFSPAAPAAGADFTLSATVQPNALASNLAVSAHFSLNGAVWTNRHEMTNANADVWTVSHVTLSPAPEPGDLLSAIVEVTFDGPGDLSPAYSSQHDYIFPGLTNGTGKLRTPLFNEVAPAAGFLELVGPADLSLSGWSVEHWNIAETNVTPLWTNAFPTNFALSTSGVFDEWANPVGFAVLSTNGFETSAPAALVLRNPQGTVADAVAWLPADDSSAPFAVDFLPDQDTVLSTNVAQGLANYLHVLGPAPSSSSRSLQAPNWVLAGRATNALVNLTQWSTNAATTAGALNVRQTNGFLRLVRVDRDADSLLDDEDNCPDTFNPVQADIDGDGLGNDCDDDMDGDGIPNGIDNCPATWNPEQEDSDGDGVGDTCDDDFDPAALPPTESFFVTFEAVTNGYNAHYPSSFSEANREWTFTDAAAYGGTNDCKIGTRAARLKAGGILALSGVLTNGLSSAAFFVGPFAAAADTPLLVLETSTDGETWSFLRSVPTSLSTNLSRVCLVDLDVPGPVHFRLRLETNDNTSVRVNLDNLRLVSTIRANADVDLDADLTVTYDGLPHTNAFAVTPANASWSVSYTNTDGDATSAPVEIGIWTAVVTVETNDAVIGATFTFPNSLVIEEPVGTPEITLVGSYATAVSADLQGTVVPNRSSGLSVVIEYGTSPSFGNKIVANQSPVSGYEPVTVDAVVSGLTPSTLYYWRIHAGDAVSETKNFTTDDLPTPVLFLEGIPTNSLRLAWTNVEGATNYVLSLYTLSQGGSGASRHESFTNWANYSYSASSPWGGSGGFGAVRTQETPNGVWTYTNTVVSNSAAAYDIGSKGQVRIAQNGWIQAPAFSNVCRTRFVARSMSSGGFGGGSSATLNVQVSTNGGASFSSASSVSLSSAVAVKTNSWPSDLPDGAILRFRNSSSKTVCLYDLYIDESAAAATPVEGYPASVSPTNAVKDLVRFSADGLQTGTTYYLTLLAQGPGWETPVSDATNYTTFASGAAPAFARWLFPPVVALGETLSTNVAVAADPLPYDFRVVSHTVQGECSFEYADATEYSYAYTLTYAPVAADLGTNTFTVVAANAHGSTTQSFAVIVVHSPYTQWLADHSVDLSSPDADPEADPDGDDFTNRQEYLAGTDPTNSASRFEIVFDSASIASNTVVWTFPGSTSRVYQLVTSTNLVDWVTNALSPDPATGEVSFTNSLLETLFSRLRATLPPLDSPD